MCHLHSYNFGCMTQLLILVSKKASALIDEKMNLVPRKFILQGCDTINRKRRFASKYKEMGSTKKRGKIRRGKAKQKN